MASRRAGSTRRSLGIQSKLLIVLLVISVVSVLTAGLIGYKSGTESLRSAEFNRMTQLRESRAREITSYYRAVTDAASIVTHGSTTVNAVREFSAAFDELNTTAPPPEAQAAVTRYYETVFAPALSERTGEPADPTLFEPTSNAAIYLQNAYTVPAGGDFEKSLAMRTAGDPSPWTAVNARYQDFFADLTTRFGFEDVLVLDTDGHVVYSAYKGAELGTNLFTGPYRTTLLADGYRDALQATSVDQTFVTDFERYPPSYDKPTPWVLSPIGSGGNIVGVLALQLSLDGINNVMTGDNSWEQDGLGKRAHTLCDGNPQPAGISPP